MLVNLEYLLISAFSPGAFTREAKALGKVGLGESPSYGIR